MNRLLIVCLAVLGMSAQAQDREFVFDENGITDYVVVDLAGKSQSELYEGALKWVKRTFVSTNEVLLSNIENELVRFQCYKSDIYTAKPFKAAVSLDVRCTVDMEFKDGKIKFDLTAIYNSKNGIDNKEISDGYIYELKNKSRNKKLQVEAQNYRDSCAKYLNYLVQSLKESFYKQQSSGW